MDLTDDITCYLLEITEIAHVTAQNMGIPNEEALDHAANMYAQVGHAAQDEEEFYSEMNAVRREEFIFAGMVAEGILNGNFTDPELGNTRTYALNLLSMPDIFTQ